MNLNTFINYKKKLITFFIVAFLIANFLIFILTNTSIIRIFIFIDSITMILHLLYFLFIINNNIKISKYEIKKHIESNNLIIINYLLILLVTLLFIYYEINGINGVFNYNLSIKYIFSSTNIFANNYSKVLYLGFLLFWTVFMIALVVIFINIYYLIKLFNVFTSLSLYTSLNNINYEIKVFFAIFISAYKLINISFNSVYQLIYKFFVKIFIEKVFFRLVYFNVHYILIDISD
ncbi:hypothetical protein SCORR_v1c03810 [Spiroplasma corruscae]|uniref:Transmembrane protein n=1 Tax=Spiroplasma corruscae TaxID=216934 RepID=A0A222ENS6_9MOLU|nr:hypothetical protein SCORR_v1c03810 [Spiroplasma corruscae]